MTHAAPNESSDSIPPWGQAELPEPKPLSWRNWASYIGPGIVMMGIQIGGGEWLYGPDVTSRYGGGLMWIATIAIVLQVFYNIECGRYALYCGEPIFTGFMRCAPGPAFWMGFMLTLNVSALVPGLSTHGAAMIAALWLDRPPGPEDAGMVTILAYICLFAVATPVLLGGKVYTTLQRVMTAKVAVVLGFCLILGVQCVHWTNWVSVFSGFLKFGHVPIVAVDSEGLPRTDSAGKPVEVVANAFAWRWEHGAWPALSLGGLATLGAFAGYAGGGGLANSTYSNFVRDQGWGMGSQVGAIPSAIGGKNVTLSHVGKVFALTEENLVRWKNWWRYILVDQFAVWAPGCFMGMALPALLSMQFAPHSTVVTDEQKAIAQALITADGMRHAGYSPMIAKGMWIAAVLTGLMVMLPSQMAVVDDFSRRWTDALWSGSRLVRTSLGASQVSRVYYSILAGYVLWSFVCTFLFAKAPQLMTHFIANFNNLAIGVTAVQLLWINHRLLPRPLRPGWLATSGMILCVLFYIGIAALVFAVKIWPMMLATMSSTSSAS